MSGPLFVDPLSGTVFHGRPSDACTLVAEYISDGQRVYQISTAGDRDLVLVAPTPEMAAGYSKACNQILGAQLRARAHFEHGASGRA